MPVLCCAGENYSAPHMLCRAHLLSQVLLPAAALSHSQTLHLLQPLRDQTCAGAAGQPPLAAPSGGWGEARGLWCFRCAQAGTCPPVACAGAERHPACGSAAARGAACAALQRLSQLQAVLPGRLCGAHAAEGEGGLPGSDVSGAS